MKKNLNKINKGGTLLQNSTIFDLSIHQNTPAQEYKVCENVMNTYTVIKTNKKGVFIPELKAHLQKNGVLKEGFPGNPYPLMKPNFQHESTDPATVYWAWVNAQKSEKEAQRQAFNEALSDFWKEVDSKVGMEVCTPFINRFPGHSFVAYDKGFVWSKTQKTVYLLRDYSGSRAYWPKGHERVVRFGDDI